MVKVVKLSLVLTEGSSNRCSKLNNVTVADKSVSGWRDMTLWDYTFCKIDQNVHSTAGWIWI